MTISRGCGKVGAVSMRVIDSTAGSRDQDPARIGIGLLSIKIMSAIWDGGPEGSTHRFVLIALADNANDDGECWPSIATISRKTGICERSVRNSLRHLEGEGWLQTQIGAARAGANRYRIVAPRPALDAPGIKCPPAPHAAPPGIKCPTPPALDAPEPSSITIIEPSLFGEDAPKPKKQTRRCRLPEGWVPNERNVEDAISKQFTESEIRDEADKFRDYHAAKATVFADWDAGWRTWIGNARKFAGAGRGGSQRRAGDGSATVDAFATVAARYR